MIQKNNLLDIKYIFLNFAQSLFSQHYQFTWDRDVRKTKIIIADRHAIDLGVAVQRPSIILQRGEVSWAYIVRGQDATNAVRYTDRAVTGLASYNPEISDASKLKNYTDLLRGYVVFNVISKNGIQAEIIADHLFKNLTGWQDKLKKSGIRQINNLSVSQEQLIKNNTEIELIGIQVSLGFTMQVHIAREEKTYNCFVYDNEDEVYEFIDFTVLDNGTTLKFKNTPNSIPKIDYTDAITLESVSGAELIGTESPNVFTLPNNAAIAGFYKLLKEMLITNIATNEVINVNT